ncbi:SAM-dependent methyltransferase [Streptomyces sp. 891-h]|uniref:SAM-dependent methyltransferase n=1 Tax=unclassified Streptomyces TaxID=2593676 RepID=UPI001FAAEBB2|nr:SAM-dependent methyltransferase [Streptomyces sp. 891-h]UNZ16513.1 methyltransferase domain-containing protein [Streptomyces sp. 891-h]
MERPAWAPQGIDLNVPSVSRMYDYYLGGSHNFEVDRETARQAIRAWPGLPKIMQANRAFMRRAIRFAVQEGITQFLDIGSGIPTFGNVHEVAHALDRGARVVYVDNDPVAVAHSRAVLEGDERVAIVSADFRSPQDILGSPETENLLDLDRPVVLMLVALLHFIEDRDEPRKCVAELARRLAPGSLLVLSHGSAEGGPPRDGGAALQEVYRAASAPLVIRSAAEIAQFFEEFEMVDPGLVALPRWRPDSTTEYEDPVVFSGFAGVGRKAGLAE